MNMRLITAVAAMTMALTACGASTDASTGASTGAAASPSATGNAQDGQLKFAQCMREHGINVPDPGADGRIEVNIPQGTDKAKADKATEECEKYLKGAVGEKGKAPDPAMRDKILKFAQCMREHGVNMPDPGENGMIKMQSGPGEEQKVKDAQEACKEFAPGFGPKP